MKTKLFFLLSTFYFLLSTKVVNAQISNPVVNNSASHVADPTGYANSVFQAVITIFFVVGIVYFLWHILFAGFHFIGSDGDPKKFEQAKNEIVYAFVGLIAMFSIFAILKLIGTTLGIQGLEDITIPIPTI